MPGKIQSDDPCCARCGGPVIQLGPRWAHVFVEDALFCAIARTVEEMAA